MQNKPSILINKIKGQNKSTNLFKHAFREVKTLPKNIFKSMTKSNFYWIKDNFFNYQEPNKNGEMKKILIKQMNIVKSEFENTMSKTPKVRQQSWQDYISRRNVLQEVLVNISPRWWEEQKLVTYHKEEYFDQQENDISFYKWGIKEILNSHKLQAWGESQIDWVKQELKDTYGNDSNYLGASLHVDEKTPHIHIFLSTIDLSFDKRKGRDVFKLSTKPFSENRFQELQTSIWKHNQKHWDKNLVRGISNKITNYNYKSLSQFRNETHEKLLWNHIQVKKETQKWKDFQQGWMLNNKEIKDIMAKMLLYKAINQQEKYLLAKQELEKLGLNFEQTNEIEKYIDRINERK